MWIAVLTVIFILLIGIDAKRLWKNKNKKEWILYFSLLTVAYILFIVNEYHILPLERFSLIEIITDAVQLFLPKDIDI